VPGEPLPGVTPAEFEEFRLGLDDFLEVESAEEGSARVQRHELRRLPQRPGHRRRGHDRRDPARPAATPAGTFRRSTPRRDAFHCSRSRPTAARRSCRPTQRVRAARADSALRRRLVEAIPDDTMSALEIPNDRDRDGVVGRAPRDRGRGDGERRIGRFGWKAQHATLLSFSADAYRNEMGITNDVFSDRGAFGVTADAMRACDRVRRSRKTSATRDAPARHRQLRELHAVPGPVRARRRERV
jgi:hypothetical protein